MLTWPLRSAQGDNQDPPVAYLSTGSLTALPHSVHDPS